MTEHRWNTLPLVTFTGLALLAILGGCGADGSRRADGAAEGQAASASPDRQMVAAEPEAEETETASEYESLAGLYERMMSGMPAADRGQRRRMGQMAGQMRHFAGMMGRSGHMREGMMGMGRGHMQRMHRGAMGAGGPAGMADWHQRMAEQHRQWAEEERAAGNEDLARQLDEMAARHAMLGEQFETPGGKATSSVEKPSEADGAALFAANCSGCHGPDGQGVPGAFPPLAGSPWVLGSASRTARIVLRGLQGPLDVEGETYYGAMPSFAAALDDDQIASLLTFVRSSWGNDAGAVTAREVAAARADTTGRRGFTAEELEAEGP